MITMPSCFRIVCLTCLLLPVILVSCKDINTFEEAEEQNLEVPKFWKAKIGEYCEYNNESFPLPAGYPNKFLECMIPTEDTDIWPWEDKGVWVLRRCMPGTYFYPLTRTCKTQRYIRRQDRKIRKCGSTGCGGQSQYVIQPQTQISNCNCQGSTSSCGCGATQVIQPVVQPQPYIPPPQPVVQPYIQPQPVVQPYPIQTGGCQCPTQTTQSCPCPQPQPVQQQTCQCPQPGCQPSVSQPCPTVQTQCPCPQPQPIQPQPVVQPQTCQCPQSGCQPSVTQQCPTVQTQCPCPQPQPVQPIITQPLLPQTCQCPQPGCQPTVTQPCPTVQSPCPCPQPQPIIQPQPVIQQQLCQCPQPGCVPQVTQPTCPTITTQCPCPQPVIQPQPILPPMPVVQPRTCQCPSPTCVQQPQTQCPQVTSTQCPCPQQQVVTQPQPCPNAPFTGTTNARANQPCSWMLAPLAANQGNPASYLQCTPAGPPNTNPYCGIWCVRPCAPGTTFDVTVQVCVGTQTGAGNTGCGCTGGVQITNSCGAMNNCPGTSQCQITVPAAQTIQPQQILQPTCSACCSTRTGYGKK